MMRTQVVLAFLLGAVVALGATVLVLAGRGLPQAFGQTAGNNEMVAIMGTGHQTQGQDVLYVIDTNGHRLAVYNYNNNSLSLTAVRNITYDMQLEEFAPHGTG